MSNLILIINGPNLNQLGQREPSVYGHETLDELNTRIRERTSALGVDVEFFQSNHEGALIDRLHAYGLSQGVLLNPGGLTHTSISLRDAVASIPIPVFEVHISNIYAREPFRRRSMISGACRGVICGLGTDGYLLALDYLAQLIRNP